MARGMNTYNTTITGALTVAGYADLGSRMSATMRRALARTADTGQVDWSAVSALPAASVVRDYEVFAFTDALQATKPLYIRVDWGLTPTGSLPTAQFWVGTATNGAGTLSGLQLGQATAGPGAANLNAGNSKPFYQTGSASVSVPRYCYASSDGSYFLFLCHFQQPGQAGSLSDSVGGFVVERTRDADGTPNGNGFTASYWTATADTLAAAASSFGNQQMRTYDTTQPNTYAPAVDLHYAVGFPPNITATTSIPAGGTVQAFGVYGAGPQPQGASKAMLLAYTADMPRMQPVTLTHYGQPTQWISCAGAANMVVPYMNGPSNAALRTTGLSLVFRWE